MVQHYSLSRFFTIRTFHIEVERINVMGECSDCLSDRWHVHTKQFRSLGYSSHRVKTGNLELAGSQDSTPLQHTFFCCWARNYQIYSRTSIAPSISATANLPVCSCIMNAVQRFPVDAYSVVQSFSGGPLSVLTFSPKTLPAILCLSSTPVYAPASKGKLVSESSQIAKPCGDINMLAEPKQRLLEGVIARTIGGRM